MKLLICTPTYFNITHGPAKFVNILYRHLNADPTYELIILTKENSNLQSKHIRQIQVHYPRHLGFLYEYIDSYAYYQNVLAVLDSFKPDTILFIDGASAYFTARGLGKKLKVVSMVNDYEYCSASLRNFRFTKEWLIKYLNGFLEKRALHRSNLVIANSMFLAKELTQSYNLNLDQVKILYKSHEHKDHIFNSRAEMHKPIDVFFLKNDLQRGGLFILISALSNLKKYQFKLTIGGNYPKAAIEIDRFPRGENVELSIQNFMTPEEVLSQMKKTDIFCVPAVREALGVANIEALSIGAPVVTTSSGGIPEVTDGEKSAFVAVPGSVSSLSEKIQECIENKELRNQKAVYGMKFVREKFSAEDMVSRFSVLLQELS